MKPADWKTRPRLPKRITSLADFPPNADGFDELPGALLEGELEWIHEQYIAKPNPVWVWSAIFQIEHFLRTHGGEVEYPPWVREYLSGAATRLLLLDPDAVPDKGMPAAIAKAMHLVPSGGGSGHIRQWRKIMDERERADKEPWEISEAEAEMLKAAVRESRAMPTVQDELNRKIAGHRKPKKR